MTIEEIDKTNNSFLNKLDPEAKAGFIKFVEILSNIDQGLRGFDPVVAAQIFSGDRSKLPADLKDIDGKFQRILGYAKDYQAHEMPASNMFNGASVPTQ